MTIRRPARDLERAHRSRDARERGRGGIARDPRTTGSRVEDGVDISASSCVTIALDERERMSSGEFDRAGRESSRAMTCVLPRGGSRRDESRPDCSTCNERAMNAQSCTRRPRSGNLRNPRRARHENVANTGRPRRRHCHAARRDPLKRSASAATISPQRSSRGIPISTAMRPTGRFVRRNLRGC